MMDVPTPRRIQVFRDERGHTWEIPADDAKRQITMPVHVWWSRPKKGPEVLLIRQENPTGKNADVIVLTLGQVYDLVDVANQAVERA